VEEDPVKVQTDVRLERRGAFSKNVSVEPLKAFLSLLASIVIELPKK